MHLTLVIIDCDLMNEVNRKLILKVPNKCCRMFIERFPQALLLFCKVSIKPAVCVWSAGTLKKVYIEL